MTLFKGIVQCKTRADYDAISPKDPDTLYLVEGEGLSAEWGDIGGDITDQTDLQNALNLKADDSDLTAHENNTSNPHQVSKAQVGLANVDNTSDANKPISTATQNALNGKANNFSNPTFYKGFGMISNTSTTKTYASIKAVRQYLPSGKSLLTVTMSCNCTQGSASDFAFGYVSSMLSILGLSGATVSATLQGNFQEFGNSGQMDRNLTGYGTYADIIGNSIELGRYYNTSGAAGGWPTNQFTGKIVEITNLQILLN